MYETLLAAREAYDEAAVTIEEATERRLIMAEEEELLQQARTPLIEARAMQHTVDVALVQENASESMEISALALAGAEAGLEDLQTRWVGMVVALAVILITIIALVLIKRQLDRQLEARRANETSQS
jgi:hypothetical protein